MAIFGSIPTRSVFCNALLPSTTLSNGSLYVWLYFRLNAKKNKNGSDVLDSFLFQVIILQVQSNEAVDQNCGSFSIPTLNVQIAADFHELSFTLEPLISANFTVSKLFALLAKAETVGAS